MKNKLETTRPALKTPLMEMWLDKVKRKKQPEKQDYKVFFVIARSMQTKVKEMIQSVDRSILGSKDRFGVLAHNRKEPFNG